MDKKMKKLPVGVSDFADIIQGSYYYVDKSLFIKEILDKGDKILLIPRPRRFGKTLNLSMLKYFFDCCPGPGKIGEAKESRTTNYKQLFDSLAISKAGKEYTEQMGQFPVIFLSFREVKELDWESCLDKIMQLIVDEYSMHYYLTRSDILRPHERNYFEKIVNRKGTKADYENSLEMLLIFLYRFYDKRAVILIDDYDQPVHAGYQYGYNNEMINFMSNFLCAALKDTDQYLEKSVVTGILRIAMESITSGFNNYSVYTLLQGEFDEMFGFTGEEVEKILQDFDHQEHYEDVKEWYNGYRFGDKVIYNPWSVINFLGSDNHALKPYWVNTSDNAIVEELLSKGGKELKRELELLVRGESIEKVIDDNIILKDIRFDEDILWSFLLMGGYLKFTGKRRDEHFGQMYYSLSVPNKEVIYTYIRIIHRYFINKIENEQISLMLTALVDGDISLFENLLKKIVLAVFSYHDFSGSPEKVYHALVMGLLVWLTNSHEITSNRESGYGRYDIMIIPRDPTGIGYVIEFKAVQSYKKETVDSAAAAALQQIEEKQYESELINRGIQNIKKLAIVFSGKEVFVKEGKKENNR